MRKSAFCRRRKASTAVFVPILSSANERLGAVCLLRPPRALHAHEPAGLLEALASHAALALENFRRFSQLGTARNGIGSQSIDAITDYIVVHDRRWRMFTDEPVAGLRNLGVPPVALVGEAVGTLRQLCGDPGKSSLPVLC